MDINDIKEISIDFFLKTDMSKELKKLLKAYWQMQEAATALSSLDERKLVEIRIGTILTFGILKDISDGKWPKGYSKSDWQNIVNMVSKYAIEIDDQEYSVFVFQMYANYIDVSIDLLVYKVSEDTLGLIRCLSEELRNKTDMFQNNDISEVDYTEECLWICLDAMIKLLSANLTKYVGRDIGHLFEGISAVTFEYGRLVLYRREQKLLKKYIDNQYVLDGELKEEYEAYLSELYERADSFRELIDNAFSPDFTCALKGSIELARATGVSENEILSTNEKREDFFLR